MRVVVYLLVFVMFMSSACKPIARTSEAYEETEEKKRMSWKKKALILAATGVAVFGSYKLFKYLDRITGQKMLESMETMSRISRGTRNFSIEHDRLPLYKLTAPDGSEHWLLGTMHVTAISLDDLPADSRVLKAFEEVTTLLPEGELDSARSLLQLSKAQLSVEKTMKTDFNLRQALGDEYMDKLNDEVSEIIENTKEFIEGWDNVKDITDTLEEMSKIERMPPAYAFNILESIASTRAWGEPGLAMDVQLISRSRSAGKKVIGLEKVSDMTRKIVDVANEQAKDPMAIEQLRKFIDAGGIANRIEEMGELRAAYVNGNTSRVMELAHYAIGRDAKKILLDERNHNWIKSRKIQKNCRHGKKCMVAVGLGHIEEEGDNLIELLTKEGFKIEKLD